MSSPRAKAITRLRQILDHPVSRQEFTAAIEEAITQLWLGPTSELPESALSDRGPFTIGVTARAGKVLVAFGAPIEWLGLSPNQTRNLAATLLGNAAAAEEQAAAAAGKRTDGEEAHGEGAARPQGDGAHEAFDHDDAAPREQHEPDVTGS